VTETLTDNAAWAALDPEGAAPRLSVLIPTYRDDPSALLKALDERGADAEIVLLDDGGGDAALTKRMAARIEKLKLPARLVVLSSNEGRAKGRNRLARHARGRHLLFLDSDMLPDPIGFLTRWSAVAEDDVPVAFGGFTLDQTPRRPEHELHRAMALKSDCTPAPERAKEPEKHVFTSNLLVRRDVFETIGFDERLRRLGLGGRRVGHARGPDPSDPAHRQLGHPSGPRHRRGPGRQVRAVGRQLRPGGRQPPRGGQRLSQLQGRQGLKSLPLRGNLAADAEDLRPQRGGPDAASRLRPAALSRRPLFGRRLMQISHEKVDAYEPDRSLKGKVRRRLIRLAHRRPPG
jgi:hypothetical protein